jgi:hypothetical protein
MMMPGFLDRIKPWTCAECGHKNISANKQACPECYAPRSGTPDAEAEAQTGQKTRTYSGEKDMREGIARMAQQGWKVVSQSSYQPRAGVGRVIALGLFAAVIKPNAKFTVVYERA